MSSAGKAVRPSLERAVYFIVRARVMGFPDLGTEQAIPELLDCESTVRQCMMLCTTISIHLNADETITQLDSGHDDAGGRCRQEASDDSDAPNK